MENEDETRGVHPVALFTGIQREIIDPCAPYVMVDVGNAFAWANSLLSVATPSYRTSTAWGSLGHMMAGAVGVARATGRRVLAIGGDGAMLTNTEVHTAVCHRCAVTWVILNDAAFGSCVDGQEMRGLSSAHLRFERVDFAALATSMGATGQRVVRESELASALRRTRDVASPFVLDVELRPNVASPLTSRFSALMERDKQQVSSTVGAFHVVR